MIALSPQEAARRLGGDLHGSQILCPGPGHSAKDRSLAVSLVCDGPEGFVVFSHAGDDAMHCRDHVRERLGLPAFEGGHRSDPEWFLHKMRAKAAAQRLDANGPDAEVQCAAEVARPPTHVAAEYIYCTAEGTPYLKVTRWSPKRFTQSHWTGSVWTGGKPEGPKIPYRLPELLLAPPQAEVFVCEGEKDADRLRAIGIVATSASEGAGKWTADLAQWFAGRSIVILADNDGPGEKHAVEVAQALCGVAREVRILRLPGLPEKGDVSDWLAADGDAQGLEALARAVPIWRSGEDAEGATPQSTQFISGSELLRRPMKPRRFLAGEAIPAGQVTELRGDGKTGKSTLGIQLCASVVTGMNWLNMPVARGPAIYLASEDDVDEVQRRLDAIAVHYKVAPGALSDLHIWPLATEDPALAIVVGGKLVPTPRWDALVAKIKAIGAVVVVLDSRADVFAGEEMNRLHVRSFIGMLRALAVQAGVAVVVLSHPSLSGMANGTGNSGSTHWTNAVRSVLYLRRPEADRDEGGSADGRLLEFGPSNYTGGSAAALHLRWSVGTFVVEDDGRPMTFNRGEAEAETERIFLTLLAKVGARGVDVGPSPGPNYAPKAFEKEPESKTGGIRAKGFRDAMNRLLDARVIHVETHGPPSRRTKYLAPGPPSQ